MVSADTFRTPPEQALRNHEGNPRRVGVEIEFAAVTARDAAAVVRDLFGGEIETVDPHLFLVRGTELGDFRCELDFQYVHGSEPENGGKPALLAGFEGALRQILGDVSAAVAPCEIVCPPVEMLELVRIDSLRNGLRRVGAEGTDGGLLYAFGAQFNPEIASEKASYVAAVLKAYMLLSEWLRAEIAVDPARSLFAFADPFPAAYMELMLAPDYWPGLETLMDNHLAYNATRNRELDLLPLFSWFDEARVRAAVDDPRINARPTFHYRLPNAHLQNPDWTLAEEWNRWCRVEYLAADRERLDEAAAAWFVNRANFTAVPWREEVRQWLL